MNAAFAPRMRGAHAERRPRYVPLAPFRAGRARRSPRSSRCRCRGPTATTARSSTGRSSDSLPDAVGAFVDWLVTRAAGRVTERERAGRRACRVAARHVCLLFRRFRSFGDDVTRPYVRALEARASAPRAGRRQLVPRARGGGGAAQRARRDRAARRRAGGLRDAARPALRARRRRAARLPRSAIGTLHPFRAAARASLPTAAARRSPTRSAVLRDAAPRPQPPPDRRHASRQLLAATRAHAGLAIWPTGEQALANVGRLIDLARRAERQRRRRRSAPSSSGSSDDAERGEAGEAPIVEEGTEGVRIMTVHRAKGLEFPVVILADPTANATRAEPVALRRSRRAACARSGSPAASPPELLEHARRGAGARARGGRARALRRRDARARSARRPGGRRRAPSRAGSRALDPVVYPPPERARAPGRARAAGLSRRFGATAVARAPGEHAPRPDGSVTPGLHRPAGRARTASCGGTRARSGCDVEETVGLRQQKLLEADERGARSEAGVAAHAAWQAERARRARGGGDADACVVVDGDRARAAAARPARRDVADRGRWPSRRAGRTARASARSCTRCSPRSTSTPTAAAGRGGSPRSQGRILGASPDEVGGRRPRPCAPRSRIRCCAAPPPRRAAAARRRSRCALDDGTLVEGVVDVAFEDDGGWTVVDFKTDVELGARLDEYRAQVRLYVRGGRAGDGPAGARRAAARLTASRAKPAAEDTHMGLFDFLGGGDPG